ncbi:MAG: SMP-30/gluconolactonase/LRE family protein [Spirochaetales bacterium]|nr:SMP-30/gluconolactonase/LRE family protein [Spirochaetales bacterium]
MNKARTTENIKTSKADDISDYIKDGLLEGIWKPEERINDQDLAEKLGVSRASVREALAQLTEAEILKKVQWKGYYVKTLSRDEIDSIVELRRAIEEIAIKRLCENPNKNAFDQLHRVVNRSREAIKNSNQLNFLKIDFNFHETLYQHSGNPYLKNAITNLIFSINIMRNLSMGSISDYYSSATASVEDHQAILTAIEEGDTEKAVNLMNTHLSNHLKNIYRGLNDRETQPYSLDTAFDMEMILGESPLWHPDRDLLVWLDIRKGLLYSSKNGTANPEILYKGDHIGGLTLQENGELLLFFNNGTIGSFNIDSKTLRPLNIKFPQDVDSVYFNDAIADPKGRVFLGSIASRTQQGAVYRIETNGKMSKVIKDVSISNGMGFSPDLAFFYHNDSTRHSINRYDYNKETGEIENKKLFYQVDNSIEPDGLTVDSEGNIIAALWNGGTLIMISPEGQLIKNIEIPALNTTSICFAGCDLKTLFITSAGGENRNRNGEKAGAIFKTELMTAGKPEYRSQIM